MCVQVFPSHFTQQRCKDLLVSSSSDLDSRLCGSSSSSSCRAQGNSSSTALSSVSHNVMSIGGGSSSSACAVGTAQSLGISTDFWDLLVKLDNMNVSRKGKASMKTVPLGGAGEAEGAGLSLEASPLGQLMNMLSHPVIRRSSLLTEKLLRLLSLISIALPDNKATEVPATHPTPQAPANATTAVAGATATATVAGTATAMGSATAIATATGPAAVQTGVTPGAAAGTGAAVAQPPPSSSSSAGPNTSSSSTTATTSGKTERVQTLIIIIIIIIATTI